MNKKTSLYFMLGVSCFVLILPTVMASTNEPEKYITNDFLPENGPYSISIFGDLQGVHRPSLFHIGPIWFLPNEKYITLTFDIDSLLWIDGENYPIGDTIKIYGFKGFAPLELGWTLSFLHFNGNILVIGNCYSIEI
jgi:hypothetical protein